MKKFLGVAILALAAASASAEYLYWQVSASTVENDAYLKANLWSGHQYYAQLNTVASDSSVEAVGSKQLVGEVASAANAAAYEITDSTLGYYIEVFRWDSTANDNQGAYLAIGKSETWSYADLSGTTSGHTVNYINTALNPQNLAIWQGGTFSTPEPTSAMLVLVGAALLGLKRRRV